MIHRVGWWGVAALGLTLLAAWVKSPPGRGPDVGPATPARPLASFVPAPIDEMGRARDPAVFREILRAQNLANIEARRTALQSGGIQSPLSPSSSHKQESESVRLAAELMRTSLQEMALAYEMTVGDLKALYRRGDAAGWGQR